MSENSEAVQVTTEGSGQTIYRLAGNAKEAAKNGYVYIYVSNESNNLVYFDNLQITHEKGPLLEESHFYPFGTEMKGISSHSLPSYVPNRYKANGGAEYGDEEWSNSSGLEIYETFYRSYNAQIGRFLQGDPMMEATVTMSGYVFSGNNPVMFTDLLGDQYQYMDRNGNKWHHADIFAGTALEGTPYTEGWGVDGFGNDTWGGGGGRGGGRKAGNGTNQDYTTVWEEILGGLNSGKGDTWSPGYGFYDGSLYPDGVNWVRLNEVVVQGSNKNTNDLNRLSAFDALSQQDNPFAQQLVYSLEEFLEKNRGKSYFQIITQQPWKDKMPGGPTLRYVRNPVDGKVMDMRHVMVVGYAGGSYIGAGIEILQWFGPIIGKPETRESAFNEQDFYSNDIGANFFTHSLFNWSFNKDWSIEFYKWILKNKN